MNARPPELARTAIPSAVEEALRSTPAIDMHTHLFMPSLGALGLWGIDQLLTYHYLEAELFRSSRVTPEEYADLAQHHKADLIWKTLFIENTPISEATRGVIAVLDAFGLSTDAPDLTEAREFFSARDIHAHIRHVLELAGVSEVVMTNDPLESRGSHLLGARRGARCAVPCRAAPRPHPEPVGRALDRASRTGLCR